MTRENAQGLHLVMVVLVRICVFFVGWINLEISVMDFVLQPNAMKISSVVRFLVIPSPAVQHLLYVYLK
jgi:hypothetical protein